MSEILERCKGKKDESFVKLTVAELKEISNERPDLADFVEVYKSVKDVKALCNKGSKPNGQSNPA